MSQEQKPETKVTIIIKGAKPAPAANQAQQSAQTDGQRKQGSDDEGGIHDVGTGFKE